MILQRASPGACLRAAIGRKGRHEIQRGRLIYGATPSSAYHVRHAPLPALSHPVRVCRQVWVAVEEAVGGVSGRVRDKEQAAAGRGSSEKQGMKNGRESCSARRASEGKVQWECKQVEMEEQDSGRQLQA